MVVRLVDPYIAHAATAEMRCRAKLKFPGDRRAAECNRTSTHVLERDADGKPSMHRNAAGTRVWRRVGYDVEASMAPGTEGQP